MDKEFSKHIDAFLSKTTDLDISVSITSTEDPLLVEGVLMDDRSLDSRSLLINDLTQIEREGLLRRLSFVLNVTSREFTNEYILIFSQERLIITDGAEIFILHFSFYQAFEQFLVQLTTSVAQGIAEHKTALDIATDFATIIGVTLPLTATALKILHLDKAHHKSEKIPSVTITIGDVSVNVADEDIKDAEHAATNIARKLLKEHPEALPSNNVNISGKLIEPPKQQRTTASPQQKLRKKRSN